MQSDMIKLMMEIAVNRSIRQLQSGDTVRALRQLVDFGRRYASTALSANVLDVMNDMLRSSVHPYFQVFERFFSEVDARYISGYGISMGSRLLAGRGPAYVVIRLDAPSEEQEALIRKAAAEKIGTVVLRGDAPDAKQVRSLIAIYPDAAYTLVTAAAALTSSLFSALSDLSDLAYAAVCRLGEEQKWTEDESRFLCFLCRRVSEDEARAILQKGALPDEDGLVVLYLPDQQMDAAVLQAFDHLVVDTRMHPKKPFVPFIMPNDAERVQGMFADGADVIAGGVRAIETFVKNVINTKN